MLKNQKWKDTHACYTNVSKFSLLRAHNLVAFEQLIASSFDKVTTRSVWINWTLLDITIVI